MASTTKRRKLVDSSGRRPNSVAPRPVTLTYLGLPDVLPRNLACRDDPPCFPCRPAELPAEPPENISTDCLQHVNRHPRDEHLHFEASDHAYFWRGRRVARSVTQLVQEFTNEFSEDHVISTMQQSTNWPRPRLPQINSLRAPESPTSAAERRRAAPTSIRAGRTRRTADLQTRSPASSSRTEG